MTLLGLGSKGLPRVFCTTQTLFCTGASPFRTSARGLWLAGSKRPFAPSPNHLRELSLFGQFPRSAASQSSSPHPLYLDGLQNADPQETSTNVWGRELNTSFFFPAKFQDIPPKSLVSLGFEAHTELFGPHTFTWKTPTPPEDIQTKKFPFSSLKMHAFSECVNSSFSFRLIVASFGSVRTRGHCKERHIYKECWQYLHLAI